VKGRDLYEEPPAFGSCAWPQTPVIGPCARPRITLKPPAFDLSARHKLMLNRVKLKFNYIFGFQPLTFRPVQSSQQSSKALERVEILIGGPQTYN
jgi:hypothetical protein